MKALGDYKEKIRMMFSDDSMVMFFTCVDKETGKRTRTRSKSDEDESNVLGDFEAKWICEMNEVSDPDAVKTEEGVIIKGKLFKYGVHMSELYYHIKE
jgi:hypothetical protein